MMNMQHNIKTNAETQIRHFADAEAVVAEKHYKLGAWLHQEYRGKFKKPSQVTENTRQILN